MRALVARTLTHGLPRDTAVLNVDFPARLAEDARWLVTTTSTRSEYQHLVTRDGPPEGQHGRWQLRFVHEPPDEVEPLPDLDVVRGKHISLTLLPQRHGLADVSWVPAERS